MIALVTAGEMIFSLPFHVARYFRPSFLEGFGLTNAALGDVFAVYGVAAMLSYFPGGVLADRWSPRRLMSLSLVATAAGGLYLATFPDAVGLAWLFGYWGVTTILLFWAPMIRATRRWGGETQGRAFGVLDGGRGLAAAAVATLAVMVFGVAASMAADALGHAGVPGGMGGDERRAALRAVILFYGVATAASAWLVLRFVPDDERATGDLPGAGALAGIGTVLARRDVWLQAGVVAFAYCGYKGLDNYSLYVNQVLGLGELEAAGFTATAAYLRPIAAVSAGLLADRVQASRAIAGLFGVLVGAYAFLFVAAPTPVFVPLLTADLLVTFVAVFGLRGVYFALLEEARVPPRATGAAVGVVSVVGYTPDVFFAPVAGRLLDATPGVGGHQHYFLLLAAIALAGLAVTLALARTLRSR